MTFPLFYGAGDFFGKGLTPTFTDIFPDFDTFKQHYKDNELDTIGTEDVLSESSLKTLYYLLYARYGDRSILFYDTNQFIYAVFSLVYMYGPTWQRRVALQSKIRNLTDDEIVSSDATSHTHAYNPGTLNTDDINYINEQNKTKRTRSKMEGLALASSLLEKDVSKEFVDKFASLFRRGVINICPVYFEMPEGFPNNLYPEDN
jgi:hypothetical protein